MKNQQFSELLKIKKNNSGFTLFELLIGLIMSLFVTGALGFGLYQILRTTSKESSKISARNEATRAIEFISDEIRRARSIESNANNARDNGGGAFDTTGKTVVLALDIPEINDGDTLDTDNDDTTSERIVYYLESSSGTNWQGPQVLYRWGPPLNATGDYTGGIWQPEALIDGIDNTAIATNPCDAGDSLNPPLANNPAGFYACISGTNNAAQIFLTGGIDTTTGDNTNYTTDTKAVARAKDVTVNQAQAAAPTPTNFETLLVDYNCSFNTTLAFDPITLATIPVIDETNSTKWDVRLDFNNNDLNTYPDRVDDTTSWVHKENRQPQPIDISTDNDLKINVTPVGESNCNSNGNPNTTGTEPLSDYTYTKDYTIKFMKDINDPNYAADDWQSFNGNDTDVTPAYNNPDVKGDGSVLVLKNGSELTGNLNRDGYNYNNEVDSSAVQDSLGGFLVSQGYAVYDSSLNGGQGGYIVQGLDNDQRILAFELGHTDPNQQGFDVQDAVFIMTNDQFAKEY
ncbi:MAG: prepilin-type N-terminal cleavage/methylation domain-containing protein [Xenococcaceae cyanobacterium MO_207.B15]|nr:prepilin-type N-terminal cleavage/methylation domain-containing protein [Xenococcaceae cyanobacterium MO_207.B15]